MNAIVISASVVIEQTMALSAMHGCVSSESTPVLGDDMERALRALMPGVAATLAVELSGRVKGWMASANEFTLLLDECPEGMDAALKAVAERWVSRRLVAQVWAQAAPGLAQMAQAEAATLITQLMSMTEGGYASAVRSHVF